MAADIDQQSDAAHHSLARGGKAPKRRPVRAGPAPTDGHLVPFGEDVVDRVMQVGKRGPQPDNDGLEARRSFAALRADVVGADELVDRGQVALIENVEEAGNIVLILVSQTI